MKYSIVIPIHNEEDSIEPLHRELRTVMSALHRPYEIIFVDDGSTDRSRDILSRLSHETGTLTVVEVGEQRGQTAALKTGFNRARGDIVISMDGDLQNDPKDIPRFLAKIQEGYGAVCGWRHDRKDPASKKAASSLGNLIQNLAFGTRLHDLSCTFRAYRRESLKSLALSRDGLHRFIPYLLKRQGCKIAEIEIAHHPRRFGSSKYGVGMRAARITGDFLHLIFKRKG